MGFHFGLEGLLTIRILLMSCLPSWCFRKICQTFRNIFFSTNIKSYVLCEPHWPSKKSKFAWFFSRTAKRQVLFQPINQPKSPNPPWSPPNPQPSTSTHGGPSMPNRRQQSFHRKWDHPRSQLLNISQTSLVETTTSLVESRHPDVFVATTADSLDLGADLFFGFWKKRPFKCICPPLGHLLFVQSHFC